MISNSHGFINKITRSFCLFEINKIQHMMHFTAFPETELNPGIRDLGDCRWAKPTFASPLHTHREYISAWVPWNRGIGFGFPFPGTRNPPGFPFSGTRNQPGFRVPKNLGTQTRLWILGSWEPGTHPRRTFFFKSLARHDLKMCPQCMTFFPLTSP